MKKVMGIKKVKLPHVVYDYIEEHFGGAIPSRWDIADFFRAWDQYLSFHKTNVELQSWMENDENFLLWSQAVAFDYYGTEESAEEKEVALPALPPDVAAFIMKFIDVKTKKAQYIRKWDERFEEAVPDVTKWLGRNENFLLFIQAFLTEKFSVEERMDTKTKEVFTTILDSSVRANVSDSGNNNDFLSDDISQSELNTLYANNKEKYQKLHKKLKSANESLKKEYSAKLSDGNQ